MTEATLISEGGRPVLRFERLLSRPLPEVWRTVTDPEEMRSWFPTRIDLEEWRVGATFVHHFEDPAFGPLPGEVLEWDPPHRVRFTWADDVITFELSAAPGGTRFVLTEELSANHVARNAAGWETCLDRLELGETREDWSVRFERYRARFEPVAGPQEGPPHAASVEG